MPVTKEAVTRCVTRLRMCRMFPNSPETITALGETLVEEFDNDRELAALMAEALEQDSWPGIGFIVQVGARFRFERTISADLEQVLQARMAHEADCNGFGPDGERCAEWFASPAGFHSHDCACRKSTPNGAIPEGIRGFLKPTE